MSMKQNKFYILESFMVNELSEDSKNKLKASLTENKNMFQKDYYYTFFPRAVKRLTNFIELYKPVDTNLYIPLNRKK